jgi:hypothetical protein
VERRTERLSKGRVRVPRRYALLRCDSEDYKDGAATSRDHWGNKLKLSVGDARFDFEDGLSWGDGATTKMFSQYEIPQQYLGKPMAIVFHFASGKTSITVTGPK